MSYKTFEISGNEVIFGEPTKESYKKTYPDEYKFGVPPSANAREKVMQTHAGYGYHEQADDECIMLDDDIYFD